MTTAHAPSAPLPTAARRARVGLDALNFSLADVRDGLGPYLAIYLISASGADGRWNEASAGLVMTIAGVVGLLVQTPAGAWVDRSRNKRWLIVAAAAAVTASCVLLPMIDSFFAVTATQAIAACAACIFAPAISAITLGIVGPRAFTRRMGRNEGFNHAGNAVSAALAGGLAYLFGPIAVFWWMAILALTSIVATLWIPRDQIDDELASGRQREEPGQPAAGVSGWATVMKNRPLVLFAIAMALFHLANAAMLTSVGQLLAKVSGQRYATTLLSVCIVVAQVVMVPVAAVVGRKADTWGRKPIFLAAFAILLVRGLLYTLSREPAWLVLVQCLDGFGAGIFGVLFPVVVADLTRGSGHFNLSQGAVATAQGVGAALSASLAGVVIVSAGYEAAFVVLAAIAALGLILYFWAIPESRGAIAQAQNSERA